MITILHLLQVLPPLSPPKTAKSSIAEKQHSYTNSGVGVCASLLPWTWLCYTQLPLDTCEGYIRVMLVNVQNL